MTRVYRSPMHIKMAWFTETNATNKAWDIHMRVMWMMCLGIVFNGWGIVGRSGGYSGGGGRKNRLPKGRASGWRGGG